MSASAPECFTENVSTHGARVVSSKPWKRNERLNLHLRRDVPRPRARGLLRALGVNSFAVGLQLLAATGKWN